MPEENEKLKIRKVCGQCGLVHETAAAVARGDGERNATLIIDRGNDLSATLLQA